MFIIIIIIVITTKHKIILNKKHNNLCFLCCNFAKEVNYNVEISGKCCGTLCKQRKINLKKKEKFTKKVLKKRSKKNRK